ncbi:hypothetical protein ZEAMMB73_Zm00001d033411 [Zea mays]|uniref:Uncharacterized protein n=1 Tax=Zea mays TaxID=4577 RepID=A0A1D6KYV9_MAIZE|nr:hypothetical protein ZEAMMB73_Zm00001d033411 [Zea mays]
MRASRGFSLLARATTWPAGEPARWAPCCGGGNPGPAGPVGARAARRGVGVLPAGVSRHCLQRAWGLEAVRPLRGVQVHRFHRPAGLHLHDAAAPPARRPPHWRPGPGAQDRPPRRLHRRPGTSTCTFTAPLL